MTSDELQNRWKTFESLLSERTTKIVEDQLLRSAFSAAVNYRAACKGQPGEIFKAKISIAFEEIDEALFWLEVINDLKLVSSEKMVAILKEADELTRILAATGIKLENKSHE